MAKSNLPSVDNHNGPTVHRSIGTAISDSVPQADGTHLVKVETEGYIPRNVDVRMTRAQARILRDKLRALQDAGAKTADGRFVDNRAQAVRWIIENEVVI
jgi:hypothetical protein